MKLFDPLRKLCFLGLLAGAACLSVSAALAQDASMEQRVEALEARIRAMESAAHVEVTVDGKQAIVEPWPDLDTFTRNQWWHGYVRAGAGFWDNGLGQTGSINLPGVGGRMRLGNENDFYMEIGPRLTHMLGDPTATDFKGALVSPDIIDVSFKMTLQFFNGVDKRTMNISNEQFVVGIVETYMEMKNVILSAPETTFWAGLRFYDRYDIHPQDYFYVGTAGMGVGVTDWDVGIGKLNIAYFGAIESGTGDFYLGPDRFTNFTFLADDGFASGDMYRHILDIRLGEIGFLGGDLKLFLEGAYQQNGDFTTSNGGFGHADEAFGVGGGLVQTWQIPDDSFFGGNSSTFQAGLFYGWGLVDFRQQFSTQMGRLNSAYNAALTRDNSFDVDGNLVPMFENVEFYEDQQYATANVWWVWNPTEDFSMGTWITGVYDDQGFDPYIRTASGAILQGSSDTWQATAGIRPYLWLAGPFCIQGSFGGEYISNSRGGPADNFDASGSLGIFTIAPTIKPRGGFWTRPEIRIFATYATWSSDLKGQVGYNNPDATDAWIFGFQGEIWF